MLENCFFCQKNRFALNKEVKIAAEESIVYEDEYVFAVPDIAPLKAGHCLIISKNHYCCFGSVPEIVFQSLERAKQFFAQKVFQGHDLLYLEHGSVIDNPAGASVDHAHLHVLPSVGFDLIQQMEKSIYVNSGKAIADYALLKQYACNNQPYLFLETSGRKWAYKVNDLPSQFFRQIIATHYSSEYDWRKMYKTPESQELFNSTLNHCMNQK